MVYFGILLCTVKINEVVDLERYLGYIIEWERQIVELFLPPTKIDCRWWKSKTSKNNHRNRENMSEYFSCIGTRKVFLSMMWNVESIKKIDEFAPKCKISI